MCVELDPPDTSSNRTLKVLRSLSMRPASIARLYPRNDAVPSSRVASGSNLNSSLWEAPHGYVTAARHLPPSGEAGERFEKNQYETASARRSEEHTSEPQSRGDISY